MDKRMISKIYAWLTVLSAMVLLIGAAFCWQLMKPADVAYIDIGKLVSGYQMKKDLDKQANVDLQRIKSVSDSLKMIKKAVLGTPTPRLDSQLQYVQYAFQQYYEQSNRSISEKIWERLNPLMEQYGKERKIRLLVGANGAGTVLYGDKGIDMTDDLIKYLNGKYEKGN